MTHTDPDEQLRDLLTDVVSAIEPGHRLSEIRARTAEPRRHSRWYAAGGAVLTTAAAVTAFAVVSDLGGDDGPDPTEVAETQAVPAYFIGDTPDGPRLYREFMTVDADENEFDAALAALENGPTDPDYLTWWRPGSFGEATADWATSGTGYSGLISVEIADESLHDRPAGMSATDAQLAIEQVVYSLQGALGRGRLPVQFRMNGNPVDQVLGVPTNEPVSEGEQLEVLALVSISDPAEGATVRGSFTATGVASSFEATVPWQVRDADGSVVLTYSATATGWEGRLHPWQAEIDVSMLAPGIYTFVALTDDPSAEGPGPTSDTRTIVVE